MFNFLAAACKAVSSRTRSRSIISIRLDTITIRIEEPESLSEHFFGESILIYHIDIQLLPLAITIRIMVISITLTVIIHHIVIVISFKNTRLPL